ncbi:class I adenylate-forming enzyme family protein [Nonomuraea gerenzanensis]|uniref:class I adenylate-forming enzyme family protein n=1 Tax=Nonomuraea gerenzanensis TaxID=93944 RepID=UPI001CD9E50B|nr:class I adenylate-forming enzyme family protein [Nonomuraea gerenzanensis]UBU18739.1 acyl--CoA ligase [Nonomuraea gerenzanensis]
MPVARHVLAHAAERPSRLAVCGPGGELTYAGLAERISGAARHLRDRGVGPGSMVAVALADPVELLTAVLAADLAGATPLVGDPAWDRRRWDHLTTASLAARISAPLPQVAGPPVEGEARPDDLAWACFSSGSTGRPRAVIRTRASWTGSYSHLDRLAGIGLDDVVLVPGPLVSSLYAFAALHTLATGATAVVPGRWPGRSLAAHLDSASVVHVVPHRLPDVLRRPGSLRVAVVGGAALDAGARAQAAAAGVRVVSYYGATELSFVAADTDGSGLRPFPGVEIEVRTGAHGPLGEVWVRSPWLSQGYLAGAAGPLRRDAGGWVTVGDLAEPYRAGQVLRLRGRGDGAIQTGGATVVPEDVEEVLRQVPGVGDVVVVGLPHPSLGSVVTAVVEAPPARQPPRALLEATARGALDAAQRPRRWFVVPSLPRNPTGKPARAQVADRLAGGDPEIRRLV